MHVLLILYLTINVYCYWQDVSNIEAHCAYLNNLILEYKLKNGDHFTSVYVDLNTINYTIDTTEAGEYQTKLVVVNNEGFSSASETSTITVIDTSVKGKSVCDPMYEVVIT